MEKDKKLSRREMLSLSSAGAATLVGAALVGKAEAKPGNKAGDAALPQVPRRVLGKTGQTIPILLFGGAVGLDPRFDPKLAEAMRFGVNYIDAADCYGGGTCETSVASFLKRTKMRDDVWITSKSDRHDPSGFKRTLATSLRKLRTNRIDMYYLHALQDADRLSKDMERTVAQLKKEGKIRFFGFSCHHGNVAELVQRASELPWIDSVMFRYNFRKYGDKELNKAMDAAHKSGVGLIAMKTQGSEYSFRDAWRKFQKNSKWTKHQAVLKAVWDDKRITAAVSAMDTLGKLRQNIAAAVDKSKLSAAEYQSLERYAADTRAMACDGCDHICNPKVDAPVQIGDTMRYLMYHDVYGEPDKAKTLFRSLPQVAQNLSSVDFRAAEAACPHGIKIAENMARAAKLFIA
ncbi:MAG: aldo/keto reductase [Proteobacteria bacterium]|nr:aldo/keto reductase [Pseudomonadota bacterium]